MELIADGMIYAGKPGTSAANSCFPAIVQLPDGTLIVTWRVGSQKDSADGTILLSRSTDEGRSWSQPQPFPSGPCSERPGEIHYAPLTVLGNDDLLAALMWVDRSDSNRPFFNPVTEGILPVQTWFCVSRDGGQSWGDYRLMESDPDCPLTLTGPVLPLGGGRLVCQVEVNKSYDDAGIWRQAAVWRISSDGGYHWPECVEVAKDPNSQVFYWDARYGLGNNGYVMAALWVYDRKQKHDLPIHLCESNDGGNIWTQPRSIGLVGQQAYPVLLSAGRVVFVYIDRFNSRSIRAVLSNDRGRTLADEIVVYQHQVGRTEPGEDSAPADYLQDMELWTFGRVQAIAGIDGSMWIVYYAGDTEATNIFWARLKMS